MNNSEAKTHMPSMCQTLKHFKTITWKTYDQGNTVKNIIADPMTKVLKPIDRNGTNPCVHIDRIHLNKKSANK